jgi:hypothetical protein
MVWKDKAAQRTTYDLLDQDDAGQPLQIHLALIEGFQGETVPLRQSSLASIFFFAPSLGSGRRDAPLGGISRAGLDEPVLR